MGTKSNNGLRYGGVIATPADWNPVYIGVEATLGRNIN